MCAVRSVCVHAGCWLCADSHDRLLTGTHPRQKSVPRGPPVLVRIVQAIVHGPRSGLQVSLSKQQRATDSRCQCWGMRSYLGVSRRKC